MSTNIFNMSDTWNNVALTYNAIRMNVTNTASAGTSKLIDLLVGGISKFSVAPDGTASATTPLTGDNSNSVATTAFVKAQGYATSSVVNASFQPLDADLTALSAATGVNDIYYRSGTGIWSPVAIGANLTFSGGTLSAAGGGGGGVVDAEYVTASTHTGLTAERVLTNTASITWDFSTPGQVKANTAAGGGNVSNSGTPTAGQYGKWVTATSIQGVSVATVLSDIGAAPINNPTFTGDPKAPTPAPGDNDTSIATTAFVANAISVIPGGGNVSNTGTPTNGQLAQWTDATHIQGIAAASLGFAPLASPVFTGDPQAPTPATADNDTSIATTAFVKSQGYAPLASPTFTGDPKAPTPAPGDSDTSIATTAFVAAAIAAGGGGGGASLTIADTPPVTPTAGSLWWESDTGILWLYYNDGTSSQWVVAAGGSGPSNVATTAKIVPITASGTYTPSPGLVSAIVEVIAAGGAGGGSLGAAGTAGGAGGGSGGYSRRSLTAGQIGASQSVTIGVGGTGASNADGGSGGDTSFGTLVIAKGGSGGQHSDVNAGNFVGRGGAGGIITGAVGDIVSGGAPGEGGVWSSNAQSPAGGGGSSALGGGGAPVFTAAGTKVDGNAATNYGSGGGGSISPGVSTAGIGGNGSAGVCIVTEFIAVSATGVAPVAQPLPGALVLVQRQDVSSPVASVDFTSKLDATYDEYEVHFFDVTPSAGASALVLLIGQLGVYKTTSSYRYGLSDVTDGAAIVQAGSTGDTGMLITYPGAGGTTAIYGCVKTARPASSVQKNILFDVGYQGNVGQMSRIAGGGTWAADTNPIDSLRFKMAAGNINAGTFILYGIKK
jgi:hypothetical protein